MNKQLVDRHVFRFNPQDNGGEGLTLLTEFYLNESGDVFTNQKLELQSYCNSASINLYSCGFNPEILRQLANELEQKRNKCKEQTNVD